MSSQAALAALPLELVQQVIGAVSTTSTARHVVLATVCRRFREALAGPSAAWPRHLELSWCCGQSTAGLHSLLRWLAARRGHFTTASLAITDQRSWELALPLLGEHLRTLEVYMESTKLMPQSMLDGVAFFCSQLTHLEMDALVVPHLELDHLSALTTLQSARLIYQLGDSGEPGFPAWLCSLTQLSRLELDYAELAALPPELSRLTLLQHLSVTAYEVLDDGYLYKVKAGQGLAGLRGLQTLRLGSCRFDEDEVWPSLATLTALRSATLPGVTSRTAQCL